MAEQIENPILKSTEYDKFSYFPANRDVFENSKHRIMRSMQEEGFRMWEPVIVNEDFKIIDGQHRYEAAKELGIPIYYQVVPGLTVRDAQRMNQARRNWTPLDWAKSYAIEGNEHYQKYLLFRDDFPFQHRAAIQLLTANTKRTEGSSAKVTPFKSGDFKIQDRDLAYKWADYMMEISQHISGVTTSASLTGALIRMFKNERYDHSRMLDKITRYGEMMIKSRGNTIDYLRDLEDLYNFKMGEESRVRFF